MITKNFKAILSLMLQASTISGSRKGCVPVKMPNGTVMYLANIFTSAFPSSITNSLITGYLSQYSFGIAFGSGTTPPTEDDYTMESKIDSGLSGSTPTTVLSLDSNGNPVLAYTFTLTNTSNSPITVSEFGYFQRCSLANVLEGTSFSDYSVMFDRTVLDNPVTIPAGEYAAFKYELKTILPS